MDLSTLTDDQLLLELKNRGYQTDNLWRIEDIDQNLEWFNEDRDNTVTMTDDQKMQLLIDVLSGDGTMQAINDTISDQLSDMFPED